MKTEVFGYSPGMGAGTLNQFLELSLGAEKEERMRDRVAKEMLCPFEGRPLELSGMCVFWAGGDDQRLDTWLDERDWPKLQEGADDCLVGLAPYERAGAKLGVQAV